ncbi:MAG: DivIVA domain-containing protein [Clostridiales Family XIII bacterium]|jgi:cell division initiation protein|nr:DivIVA domain-containing protein [Clostridiales Family XIII bacterium]
MLTPLEIQDKDFDRAFRGYDEEGVESFLSLVALDFERLIADNRSLNESVDALGAELERYRGSENAVLETLEAAKALMGEISASAERRAEILLKNAESEAERIQREARESVERLTEEALGLRNRLNMFKNRYKALIETELERFDTLSAELFEDGGLEDMARADDGKPAHGPRAVRAEGGSAAFADGGQKASSKTLTNLRGADGA